MTQPVVFFLDLRVHRVDPINEAPGVVEDAQQEIAGTHRRLAAGGMVEHGTAVAGGDRFLRIGTQRQGGYQAQQQQAADEFSGYVHECKDNR